MINSLTEGISMALNKEFGDDCTVFAEPVEQGLKEPCFFVFCISPVSRPFMGKRYLRTHKMCVQYFPEDTDRKYEECCETADRLFDCLEYITADGYLIRGTKMSTEIVDGILNFFVNYDFFVRKTEHSEAMEEISENVDLKG
jgi:hypothetical protein